MKAQRKLRIQNQLRQYLKQFRNINGLSAEQACETIGVEIATYRILEGKKPARRIITILEYLESLATLNGESLTSFVAYLERDPRTESGSKTLKRKMFEWEKSLLERFDLLGIPLRNRFLKYLEETTRDETTRILGCMVKLFTMPESRREALFNLIDEMDNDET